ncbi:MAG: glucoamylase family protein [Sphingobacteriaceae bacterium]
MTRYTYLFILLFLFGCKKSTAPVPIDPVITPTSFSFAGLKVNGTYDGFSYDGLNTLPVVKISFSAPVNRSSVSENVTLVDASGKATAFILSAGNNDSIIVITPSFALQPITRYILTVNTGLLSNSGSKLQSSLAVNLLTAVSDADKFPRISNDELLALVQKQTLKYFWDFGHPISGLARERNTSGDVVTTGGSGFGVMAIVTGINRGWISRADGLERMQKIVNFLKTRAQRFHGVYPHWLNGATGAAVPFSTKDDGADLVETAFLIQGLLTVRQYFSGSQPLEIALRADINTIWLNVEWNWFQKNMEDVLYWHWSPRYNWDMNMPVRGWNEALVTYALAAASPKFPISKLVYDNGWANNGAIKNGKTFYGVQLPLGSANGGPLFFAHYSFLGINPNGLTDAYANYATQNTAHALINYKYCDTNPKNYYGYSKSCWGLTASDDYNGYSAHEPNNDNGVISPTAALSSFPYTPEESRSALNFFYYKLGDKLWNQYGFVDAFSLNKPWFATSTLAIDQGPIIVMIENYRSGLLWDLFMSCPEVKVGMRTLGFKSPHL